ncbi:Protein disulfide-isomerase A3-like [Oopsacas minuta]|uniref:Protein disulfide-isomerase n=1 Tax=Oopsacas minuta TaxID=111878 RepID=A0AAV7K1J7_9METZ|nr:Protein disulfide-isomerase A3-like [Oopsacas minuta]
MFLFRTILGTSDIIELTDDNFNEEIAKHEIILVEFFAPWCGHCKKLAPEYSSAASKLKSSSPPVPLANVECTELGKNVCVEQGIKGYPTLKIFRNGEFSADYDGPRNSDGIVSYMQKQAAPSSLFISSQEKLNTFIDNSEPSIIGYFEHDGSDSILRDSFVKCSNKMRANFRFAHAYETPSSLGHAQILPENIEGEQVWLYQPVRLRSKLDASAIRISESGPEEMEEFIIHNFMGLVGIREPTNSKYFDDITHQPQLIFFSKLNWEINLKTINYWRNRIIKIAKEYKSQMSFSMSDSTTYKGELTNKFGIIQTEELQAVIQNNGRKYVMHQDRDAKMSPERLLEFVEEYFDGKIKAYLKSEMTPIDNTKPVKTVVGRTFEEMILENDKDVLLEFYAPWCGHCKSLAPKLDELAEKLESNSNVVIAKLDATANDFPEPFHVEGFPTLYWVPADAKDKPVKYNGGREVSDLMSYIQKQATIPFKLPSKKNEL